MVKFDRETYAEFFAGIVGGASGIIVAQPMDTAKVLLQSHLSHDYSTNIFKTFQKIFKEEGVGGLYKGMVSPILGDASVMCLLFGVERKLEKHFLKKKQLSNKSQLPISDVWKCGMISGFLQCFVSSPTEYIKIQMQVQHLGKKVYKNNFSCINSVIRTYGYRGLFRGLGSTLLRDVPTFGCYFATFELFQRYFARKNLSNSTTTFISGGMGGAFCWICAYPFDVIKTKIQSQPINQKPTFRSTFDCAKQIYKTEGITRFSRGLSSCLLRSFPLNGVTFLVYEFVMKMMLKEKY